MLKKLPLKGMHYLYLLAKAAKVLGPFPIRWKTATVVLLPKILRPESATSKYKNPSSLLSAARWERPFYCAEEVVNARTPYQSPLGFRQEY
ncbi:hypothetical protein Zmor_003900 [Zophobas morio]|uniref:Uncharacterized protein n=1 Tax=Zophobas morio TaxID=2755281 RepID=A0AA38HKX6_9CUCU|nr:hypothetical protein Zmor_003900 [Zophobas morio]